MQGHLLGNITKGTFAGSPRLKNLVLENCGIRALEEGAFEGLGNLTNLNLKYNGIKRLTKGMFAGLTSVMDINLDSNDIRSIGEFTFEGLRNNVMLKMENNYNLKDISPQAFEGSVMQEIYFYNCSLTDESLEAFIPLKYSLSVFFVSNNRIPLNIPEDLFKGFQLLSLNLAHNDIHDVSFLSHVITDDLSLEYNEIGTINFTEFPSLHRVRILRLGHTLASSLDGSMFKGMDSLSQLYLAHNDITPLPESLHSVFAPLERLTLEGNPLHCNCELIWFKKWLTITPGDVINHPHCATPHTKSIADTEEEELVCTAPSNIRVSQEEAGKYHKPTLHCTAEGDPAPIISWTIPGGNTLSTPISLDRNMQETMGAVEVELEGGRYLCSAHNIAGNVSRVTLVDSYKMDKQVNGCVHTRMTWMYVVLTLMVVKCFADR